jgi:hypothetical protein
MGFFICKVDELGDLLEITAFLAKFVNTSIFALHDKSRLLESLDVTIYRTR